MMHQGVRWTLAAGALLGAAAVSAQGSMQIYGVADTGIEYLDHIAEGGTLTRMPAVTAGHMPSRLGFKGEEDLGGGLKAVFVLETGMALGTGSLMQSGRSFGRQAYLGLSGDWGTLALGRQYAMGLYAMMGSDLMGPAVYGLGSLDAYLPNQRLDNAFTYRGTFGAWTLGAAYSNARDGSAPSNCGPQHGSACAAYSALVKYDNRRWGVALAHDRLKGVKGSGFFGQPAGLTIGDGSRDDHTYLTGYVMVGGTRLGAGVIRRELEAVGETYRSNQYYAAVSHPLTRAVTLDATYTYLDADRSGADAQLLSVRATYSFSRRTAVYALAGHVFNGSRVAYSVSGGSAVPASPGVGQGQTGLMAGLRHQF
ncbi:porin [Castellaniella defragrans]|uniref:porin n=1 Tax=Castellaniella defragrans TaxID=75697 RepID=UPI0023F355F6|nr:porin [Castellaniella defragrans]